MFSRARTADEAIDELEVWLSTLPGEFSVDVYPLADQYEVKIAGSLISSTCRLTATIVITEPDDEIDVPEYRFDLRQPDGTLVWRHDCHPGHASDPGMTGPQHLHVLRGAGEVRLPEDRRTLESIREALVLANQQRAPEG